MNLHMSEGLPRRQVCVKSVADEVATIAKCDLPHLCCVDTMATSVTVVVGI